LFRVISNSTRRAKAKWFLEHTWMKYSKTQDSVYCAPLRFFGPYVNCIRFQIKLNPLHIWQNNISKSTTYLYYIALLKCKLIFYFSKFMFKSWLVAHENWVSVGSFLVPGNFKNAGFCRKVCEVGRVTKLLNRFEYTSFWGSYAPVCAVYVDQKLTIECGVSVVLTCRL
jgi:hypothetical protein